MTFKKDLKLGKRGEEIVENLLRNAGFSVKTVDKSSKSCYDKRIIFTSDECCIDATVEVKFDRLAESTGNFCLEYFNPKTNKPSGINITSSDLYIYIIPDGANLPVWVTSVKLLKKYILNNPPFKDLKKVGDGNSNIYLYKLDDILKIFKRIDNISVSTIPTVIKNILKGKL